MAVRKYKSKKEKSFIYIGIVSFIILVYFVLGLIDRTVRVEYGTSQNQNGYYHYSYVSDLDYYNVANGLVKNDLKEKLNIIINRDIERISYFETKGYLSESDLSTTDKTKVYNVYDSILAPSSWQSTSWRVEHVWPNARLGVASVSEHDKNIASDLHNLRAGTPMVCHKRSDRFFSKGSGDYNLTEEGGFYPGDKHKGDVARIILYMFVMYEHLILTDDIGSLLNESDYYSPAGTRMGELNLLLKWHKEDPVDAFEKQRNQVIYEIQGNRNPFIDKPEYVHLIWENKEIKDLLASGESLSSNKGILISMLKEKNNEIFINKR